MTIAPSSAKRLQVAAPMPWAAPVTMQILFFSRMLGCGDEVKEFQMLGNAVFEVSQGGALAGEAGSCRHHPCTSERWSASPSCRRT